MLIRQACLLPEVLWAGATVAVAHQHEVGPAAGVREHGSADAAAPSRSAGRSCLQLRMPHAEIPAWVPTLGLLLPPAWRGGVMPKHLGKHQLNYLPEPWNCGTSFNQRSLFFFFSFLGVRPLHLVPFFPFPCLVLLDLRRQFPSLVVVPCGRVV